MPYSIGSKATREVKIVVTPTYRWNMSLASPTFPELQNIEEITQLYQAAFDREPDAAGLAYWDNQMTNQGVSFATVAENFTLSPEFTALYGPTSGGPTSGTGFNLDSFIVSLYHNILGRDPDVSGLQYWESSTLSPAAILASFAQSTEFQNLSAAGVNTVVNDLANGIALDPAHPLPGVPVYHAPALSSSNPADVASVELYQALHNVIQPNAEVLATDVASFQIAAAGSTDLAAGWKALGVELAESGTNQFSGLTGPALVSAEYHAIFGADPSAAQSAHYLADLAQEQSIYGAVAAPGALLGQIAFDGEQGGGVLSTPTHTLLDSGIVHFDQSVTDQGPDIVTVSVPGPTQIVDVPVPGPTQIVDVDVPVPGPTQIVDVPGPPVPGPTQIVDVPVPGPTQIVDVPGPTVTVDVPTPTAEAHVLSFIPGGTIDPEGQQANGTLLYGTGNSPNGFGIVLDSTSNIEFSIQPEYRTSGQIVASTSTGQNGNVFTETFDMQAGPQDGTNGEQGASATHSGVSLEMIIVGGPQSLVSSTVEFDMSLEGADHVVRNFKLNTTSAGVQTWVDTADNLVIADNNNGKPSTSTAQNSENFAFSVLGGNANVPAGTYHEVIQEVGLVGLSAGHVLAELDVTLNLH